MARTFPCIRARLLVGIGGGVPSNDDIRLGDVVVGTKVLQYDLGKAIGQGYLQRTAILREPPFELRTVISHLKANYEKVTNEVAGNLSKLQKMRAYTNYARAGLLDRLFVSTYDHKELFNNCNKCDPTMQVVRPVRSDENPHIHYGTIGSGNQVMKHGETRNQLAQEHHILCFEMEAAGVMDVHPHLVIRGICDYSDSHKSKEWQDYAAVVAAAYAKTLLSVIPPDIAQDIPAFLFSSTPNQFAHETSAGPDHVSPESLEDRRKSLLDSLKFEEIDSRHSNIKAAYAKTCQWLLKHPDYVDWSDTNAIPHHHNHHHRFLWINGKPGSGKSTLMKFAYTKAMKTAKYETVTAFFFNARGADLEKSTTGMYRSLLLQLLKKLPDLQDVLDDTDLIFRGRSNRSTWDIEVLRTIFSNAIERLGQRRLTCFVDALDECDEQQVQDMVEYFEDLAQRAAQTGTKFYICFSSRHYPYIHIRYGQKLTLEEQVGHKEDLEQFVQSHLKTGTNKAREAVQTEVLEKSAGIFMWAVLVVSILNKEFERGRIFAVKRRLREIPTKLSELFKDILTRDNQNMADLLLCIQWILYAKRPLRPEEFYFAIVSGLDPESDYLAEWSPEQISTDDMHRFVLSSSKGVAEVTNSKDKTVQFIHESVRDFLLKDHGLQDLWADLGEDFQTWSHNQLKKCCQRYIQIDVSSQLLPQWRDHKANSLQAKGLRQRVAQKFPFLQYATQHLLHHANAAAADLSQEQFLETFDLAYWIDLNDLFEQFEIRRHTEANLLYILAENDYGNLIRTRYFQDPLISLPKERYHYPFFAALANGNRDAVRAFLQQDQNFPSRDEILGLLEHEQDFKARKGQTILLYAIDKGLVTLTSYLLRTKGADPNWRDRSSQTPLSLAASNGHTAIVRLLLQTEGIEPESLDSDLRTPLHSASVNGHTEVVIELLATNIFDIESRDVFSCTPLSLAASSGYNEVVELLLAKGAKLEPKDDDQETPLLLAAKNGHEKVVQLLVAKGANLESKDGLDQTPLFLASQKGYGAIVEFLVSNGANLESMDHWGQKSLSVAAAKGHERIAQLLIDKGADIESKDNQGWTPLSLASKEGHKAIVQLLLTKGADLEPRTQYRQTPLCMAASIGHVAIVQLLVAKGANLESRDDWGQTPLSLAAIGGHEAVVQLLNTKGDHLELMVDSTPSPSSTTPSTPSSIG